MPLKVFLVSIAFDGQGKCGEEVVLEKYCNLPINPIEGELRSKHISQCIHGA